MKSSFHSFSLRVKPTSPPFSLYDKLLFLSQALIIATDFSDRRIFSTLQNDYGESKSQKLLLIDKPYDKSFHLWVTPMFEDQLGDAGMRVFNFAVKLESVEGLLLLLSEHSHSVMSTFLTLN